LAGPVTLSIEFPESLELDYVELKGRDLVFNTPWGKSPEFKEFIIHDEQGDKKVPDLLYAWLEAGSKPG